MDRLVVCIYIRVYKLVYAHILVVYRLEVYPVSIYLSYSILPWFALYTILNNTWLFLGVYVILRLLHCFTLDSYILLNLYMHVCICVMCVPQT